MSSTQQKFEQRLQKIAEQQNVDLVKDATYSNVGTYSFQVHDKFKPLFTFPFNWSGRSGSFDSRNAHVPESEVQTLQFLVGPSQANPAGVWLGVTDEDLEDALLRIEGLVIESVDGLTS